MTSNTPKFDSAIADYFAKLKLDDKGGQWRACRFSGKQFYVRPEDVEFCQAMKTPLPTLAPYERYRLRFSYSNSYNLFKVKSALTGQEIISEFPPNTPYKVYEHQTWYSDDGWDRFAFGMSYDPAAAFFELYKKFALQVPRPSLRLDKTSVNSDYSHASSYLKNCYLVFDSSQAQDCAFGIGFLYSRDCLDGCAVFNSQECYDCFEAQHLYRCRHTEYAENCLNGTFLFDCRDCIACFMCSNQRHKKYMFRNQQLSKSDYEKKMSQINLGDRTVVARLYQEFYKMKKSAFHKENHNEKSVNCRGDYIKNSKNCWECFYQVGCENVSYAFGSVDLKDSFDVEGGIGSARIRESYGGQNNHNIKFSLRNMESHDLEYCDQCENCHDCFACIGLKNKSFCIFNVQYSEDEYWRRVDELKTAMLARGEYGEFFPPWLAFVPYNISSAMSFEGFDDIENARKYGYPIETVPPPVVDAGSETIKSDDLPADIKDVDDSILQKVIRDEKNGKVYRITRMELDFYRRYGIPLPTEHYTIRLARLRKKIGLVVARYFQRACDKCRQEIESTHDPALGETVFCEQCYYGSL